MAIFPYLRDGLKNLVKKVPVLRQFAYFLKNCFSGAFPGSERYWEARYAKGGHSGVGSTKHLAKFKAGILNSFVKTNKINTVLEFGCGDGNQLELASYPHYTGFDVSLSALRLCKEKFKADKTRIFKSMNEYQGQRAELTLSLDVIYHLVEDASFQRYMQQLFSSSDRYVVIYSSNTDKNPVDQPKHIKHRKFTEWVGSNAADWELLEHIPNKYPVDSREQTGSFSDFFIYGKKSGKNDENLVDSIR